VADGLSGRNDSDVQRAGARGARTAISLSTVLDEIRARGTMGITFSELQAATGRTYNSVGPRVRELKSAGLVIDSGARRQSLLSTKNQVVWEIHAPVPGPVGAHL
jgi:predicted sugar kinase